MNFSEAMQLSDKTGVLLNRAYAWLYRFKPSADQVNYLLSTEEGTEVLVYAINQFISILDACNHDLEHMEGDNGFGGTEPYDECIVCGEQFEIDQSPIERSEPTRVR